MHGAGTGSIRAMLNGMVEPGSRVLLHKAHPYKTTLPAMQHMGLDIAYVDFNDESALAASLRAQPPATVYVQHVPQQLGDRYGIAETIELIRSMPGATPRILVDDNYAVMRSQQIGVEMGADASALSLFKLLAPQAVGAVLADGPWVARIRRDNASAGAQVQGPHSMAALRSLIYAPVALAIQNQTVLRAVDEINAGIAAGDLPFLAGAYAAQPGIRCIVLLFDRPAAEEFLRSAWRNGSPSQSVGEEAQFEFLPLFTYLTSTFLKASPGLEKYAVRINPLRGGSQTVMRVLRHALADHDFQAAVGA